MDCVTEPKFANYKSLHVQNLKDYHPASQLIATIYRLRTRKNLIETKANNKMHVLILHQHSQQRIGSNCHLIHENQHTANLSNNSRAKIRVEHIKHACPHQSLIPFHENILIGCKCRCICVYVCLYVYIQQKTTTEPVFSLIISRFYLRSNTRIKRTKTTTGTTILINTPTTSCQLH